MFKEIEIKGYRGLKNIKFSSKNVIENAIAIARKREVQFAMPIGLRLMPYDMLLYSFPIDKQEIKEIDISGYRDEVGVQYGRAVTLIEMEDCGLVPVSIFGDGLKKVLTLASAAVKTRGGILLIDEFETGIHRHALIQVAKWLAMATERYDVQVFVTTHSDDAIDALVSTQDDYNNINAYRLEHYRDRIFVKKFEGTDLYRLRREQGMDIL